MTTKFKVGDLVQGKSTRKIYRVITWEEYNKAQMALKSFVLRLTPEADRIPIQSVTNGTIDWEWLEDLELVKPKDSKEQPHQNNHIKTTAPKLLKRLS
jgi:hypothetical protein